MIIIKVKHIRNMNIHGANIHNNKNMYIRLSYYGIIHAFAESTTSKSNA